MFPPLFTHQGQSFHTWGLMVTLAFLVACLVLGSRVGRVGMDSDKLVPFYMIIISAGLLGSRLLHFVFAETDRFFADPLIFFDVNSGGFAFYGGAILATLAGAWYGRWAGLHMWKLIDAGAPCMMLGLAIGRLGCFSAGCCHGQACPAPETGSLLSLPGGSIVTVDGPPFVAFNFVDGLGVGSIHGIPVYPTQLWESAGAFGLFLVLSWMWSRARRFDGQIMAALLLLYPVLRSTIESFRGDAIRGTDWLGVLSTSQLVSVPMLILGVGIIAVRARRGLEPETPFVLEED
jgi:phosphatidylglycerol:prolipoprotein diacylglycerol transferase